MNGNGTQSQSSSARPCGGPAGISREQRAANSRLRNLLDRKQSRQLENWLDSQFERISRDRPYADDVAKEASAALGFKVSEGNVRGACKVLDRELPIPKRDRRTSDRGDSAGFKSQTRLALWALADATERLYAFVDAMSKTLGNGPIAPPDNFVNLKRQIASLRAAAASTLSAVAEPQTANDLPASFRSGPGGGFQPGPTKSRFEHRGHDVH